MLTSRRIHVWVAALLLAGAAAAFAEEAQPSAKEQEGKLIAVLKSDAPLKEKADACRLLARIGTKDAVAPLAAMLGDEKLSHMARYGLETIADPSVDDALRDALGKLKGPPLVGVIGSIGVRRDAKAVPALVKRLGDADAEVAQGAARALGKIGTPGAAQALGAALDKALAANQLAFCEGLFRCAEGFAASGKRDDALAIYDRLRGLKGPHQVRAGGLRGAILTRGKEGLPLLLEGIRGDDFVLVAAAARTAMEMADAGATKALADELPKLSADKQILVIQTLGKCGDGAALPALLAAAKRGDKAVRVEAVRAVPEVGGAAAAPELVKLMGDAEADVARAAQEGLAALPGEKVDAAVVAMLRDPDADTRRTAVELLGQRRVLRAIPDLLKAAGQDGEETIRVASIKVLGNLGGEAELQPMLGLLTKAKSAGEIQAAEGALSAICIRQSKPVPGKVVIVKAVYGDLPDGRSVDVTKKVADIVKEGSVSVEASNSNFGDPANGVSKSLRVDYTVEGKPGTGTVREGETLTITASVVPPACTDALCGALAQAKGPAKTALLRVLGVGGGAKALDVVRAATKDPSAEVKDTALRILCEWPTADALPDLAQLAKAPPDAKLKVLALRGYIRLIPLQDVPAEKQLASLKEAMALAERKEEKRLALAALGAIPSVDALAFVKPLLDDAVLKEEACMAAVAVAEKIVKSHPAQVAEAMEQVSKATGNKQVEKRAKALLEQARKAAPK